MRTILAIDPGTAQSGVVMTRNGRVLFAGVYPNGTVRNMVRADQDADILAIEMIASYGMAVGAEVFETCVWIGRFQQSWRSPESVRLIYRKDVKLHLCGTPRAKDPNIRQALIDKLGAPGTKSKPGPTFGVSSHAWAALAVAVTAEAA